VTAAVHRHREDSTRGGAGEAGASPGHNNAPEIADFRANAREACGYPSK
jgi:hypothetical protein